MSMTDDLEAILQKGQDSPLLRYGLGGAYLKALQPERAVPHLAEAVRQDPTYSAAWKLYGRALAETGAHRAAAAAFDEGIAAAQQKGDLQAVKEMQVFRKRAERAMDGEG